METNRRGFLKGLAGLVSSPLLLSAVPMGTASASPSPKPLIWTPEDNPPITLENVPYDLLQPNGPMLHRLSSTLPASRFMTITVQDEQGNRVMEYACTQQSGLFWQGHPSDQTFVGDRIILDMQITTRPR